MENRKFIKFLIPILMLGFFIANTSNAFAYNIETHAYLTNEIIEFYNQNFSDNKIPDELKNYLVDGSRQEDNPPRWMNHFYDPVHNRGLTDPILGTWQKSKDWAQDNNNQNSLTYKVPVTIASVLTTIQQRKISALTTETNFTWQKAIEFYARGEKEKAMFALGHILHLLEDKSVPDHTRNDHHITNSPYETYTKQFNLNNPDTLLKKNLTNKKPLILNDLDSYFRNFAIYSNNNFYSKDTIGIQSSYKLPEPDYFQIGNDGKQYGMKIDIEFGDYFLAKTPSKLLTITLDNEEFFKGDLVIPSYWSRLSTKSIQYGAGIINLFLQEAKEAKNNLNFAKTENKSFLAQTIETIKDLFKAKNNFQFAGQINLDNNQSQDSQNSEKQKSSDATSQSAKQCPFQTSQSPSHQKIIINEVAWMGTTNSASNEWIELKNTSNSIINLGGYQLIDQAEQIKIVFNSNDKIAANSFYLLERTSDDSALNVKTDKIYTGQISNTNEGLRLFNNNCDLIDEALAKPNWPAGDNVSKKTMERASNLSWHTSSIIGGTPKKENSQLIPDKKEVPLKNLPEEIEEDNEAIPFQQKELIKKQEPIKQTTTTPRQITINTKQCAFQTSQSLSRQKIIINEIAWMGTTNSANDEWIELKNISGAEMDLNGWQLIDQGEQIKINFNSLKKTKLKSGEIILLERTSDNTVQSITADIIYSGQISNTNEGLRLFDQNCNLIDEIFAKPNWPAGDNVSKRTMERKSDLGWQNSSQPGGTPKAVNSSGYIFSGGEGSGAPTNTQQQTTSMIKILINEVQIAPTEKRFIEIYNPNNYSVDLSGYYLQRKTSSGASFNSLVSKTYFEGKTINANSYLLISRANLENTDIVSNNLTLTESNTIQFKNGDGVVIDKVGWGEAQDCENNCALNPNENQSIQRKINNNSAEGFIDTDNNFSDFEIQSCPSPKTQNCQQTNQALGAFFVYSPQNPAIGDLIAFSASSSTGQTAFYQWDFGDNTTSSVSVATNTHTYHQAGNYIVQLTVFNDQKTSSSTTSTMISIGASGANHVVISEIQAGATDSSSNEFIELYNPTSQSISLTGWELRKRTSTGVESNLLDDGKFIGSIPAKGFFLIAHPNYSGSKIPDLKYSTTAEIAHSNNSIVLYNGDHKTAAIVDSASYNEIQKNKSLERKNWRGGQCFSSQLDGEFLGNNCDTNNISDFEIRDIPNAQNSFSLPEPRDKPTIPQNFFIQYDYSSKKLIFNWEAPRDYSGATSTLIYKIVEINNSHSPLTEIETNLTTAETLINEANKKYDFSIQAIDKEGLASDTSTASIDILNPKFRKFAYSQLDDTAEHYLRGSNTAQQWTENLGKGLNERITQICVKVRIDTDSRVSNFYMWQQTTDDLLNELGRVHVFANNDWLVLNTEPAVLCQNFDFTPDPDKFIFIMVRPNYYMNMWVSGSPDGKIFYEIK